MRRLPANVLILITGFFLGYATKAILFTPDIISSDDRHTAYSRLSTSSTQQDRGNEQRLPLTGDPLNKPVIRADTGSETPISANIAGTENFQVTENIANTNEHQSSPKQTTNSWVESHKLKVFDTIARIAPETIAEGMQETVAENSEFLKRERENKLGRNEEETWGYGKSSELRAIFASHSLSADFEISSITCKQLMCEVIGYSYNSDSWHQIHSHVFNHAKNIIPPWNAENELLNLQFRGNDVNYVYSLYEFSE